MSLLQHLKSLFTSIKDKLGLGAGTAKDARTLAEAMQRIRTDTQSIYSNAEREIAIYQTEYANRFSREEQAQKGTEAYTSWKRTSVYSGSLWDSVSDSSALAVYDANMASARILNAERAEVFRSSYDRTAYEIEKLTGKRMEPYRGEPNLPPYRLNVSKDTGWNRRKIAAAVAQGIAAGESLTATAQRIAKHVARQDRSAFLRTARTALTGAQNAGRDAAMQRAASLGIAVKKLWIATLDNRTRDTHRDLDGQIVDLDKPFTVQGQTIRYPGDPLAPPALVYNCRCTMGFVYPEYPEMGTRRDNITGETIPYVTYREWEKSRGSSAGRRF